MPGETGKNAGAAGRHDASQAGDSYEAHMGRWSRLVARRFLVWLGARPGRDWLEVGCGTGALTAAVLDQAAPARLLALDTSEDFLAAARATLTDPRVEVSAGDALALPLPDAGGPGPGFDVVVSGLVLNFLPERHRALMEMKRVARPGAVIGFYVWDYPGAQTPGEPGGGMGLLSAFWQAAAELDPAAADLAESRRFAFCTPQGLIRLSRESGLGPVETTALQVAMVFADFDDYWRPFTLGSGPAPGYCAGLAPEAREALRRRLEETLPRARDGSIPLTARAWGVKAVVV